MFWVNLFPTLLAIGILCYEIFHIEYQSINFKQIPLLLFFTIGILMEVGYFLQTKYEIYSEKKILWILSICLNASILIAEIIAYILERQFPILTLYPLYFLFLSIKGLRLTNKIPTKTSEVG